MFSLTNGRMCVVDGICALSVATSFGDFASGLERTNQAGLVKEPPTPLSVVSRPSVPSRRVSQAVVVGWVIVVSGFCCVCSVAGVVVAVPAEESSGGGTSKEAGMGKDPPTPPLPVDSPSDPKWPGSLSRFCGSVLSVLGIVSVFVSGFAEDRGGVWIRLCFARARFC